MDIYKNIKEALESKSHLLIDTFDTFILPGRNHYNGTRGFENKNPRDGFREFLANQKSIGTKIGIHTDGFPTTKVAILGVYWRIDEYVDLYFGEEFLNNENEKDFNRMMKELGGKKHNTLVIGDGYSDTKPAISDNIDLLLIPPIPKKDLIHSQV